MSIAVYAKKGHSDNPGGKLNKHEKSGGGGGSSNPDKGGDSTTNKDTNTSTTPPPNNDLTTGTLNQDLDKAFVISIPIFYFYRNNKL